MKDIVLTTTVYEGEKQIYESSANLMCYLQTIQSWIPCSERLPKIKYEDGIPVAEGFIVTVKETWNNEEPKYHTDLAWNLGDYIDDYWDTYNDWKEGQDVHVIAWMPLPEPYNGDSE